MLRIRHSWGMLREQLGEELQLLLAQLLVLLEVEPEERKGSINDPRPRITSALPFDTPSRVAKR